ncbi:hypothetical protein [Streptococcus agalactiae]|uniref:hypothetical protein n=1 Tax=Streptococcus agalactiae TaxID=1311 RepID=UPI000B9B2409|nr:hypothetical protein [Streptococcus agalactiae]MBP3006656.1 hypothetical protein [Streptococcus agalactiae]MBP3008567.1 hypothetical protein [Streptococcus agalactiae]MBP3013573.1 hypothetical protein [Streptococcus agalactiae]MBP3018765.1 hypothetical protein [Streptococcus agalactiae]MBP3020702.1 hypothetical protein [Streptococcus agalactiae]
MATRINIYFNEETLQKFSEIKSYLLADVGESFERPGQKHSATVVKLIDVFYKLFLGTEDKQNFSERLARLEKNLANSDEGRTLKSIRRQMDQLLYLELTNFHAITKASDFDIQDLESVHSRFDPAQHELMARIDDIIKEDVARGQTIKNSH